MKIILILAISFIFIGCNEKKFPHIKLEKVNLKCEKHGDYWIAETKEGPIVCINKKWM